MPARNFLRQLPVLLQPLLGEFAEILDPFGQCCTATINTAVILAVEELCTA